MRFEYAYFPDFPILIWFNESSFVTNTDDFVMDKGDAQILREIVPVPEDWGRLFSPHIEVELNDERQVYKLETPSSFYHLSSLIESMHRLEHLTHLDLFSSFLTSIPSSFWRMHKLKDLNLQFRKLKMLPEGIGNLVGLEKLNLKSKSGIKSLPPSIGNLQNLKELDLSYDGDGDDDDGLSQLGQLPEEIGALTRLTMLNLKGSGITSLPSSFRRLQNLKELDLRWTKKMSSLPEEIGELSKLEKLNLMESGITTLPSFIGQLKSLKTLNLGWVKNLKELPNEIGELSSLNVLDISGLEIKFLPASIGNIASLNILIMFGSAITSLPPSIGQLQNLRTLNLNGTDDLLELPEEVANLTRLKELHLDWSASKPPFDAVLQNFRQLDLKILRLRDMDFSVLLMPDFEQSFKSLLVLKYMSCCTSDGCLPLAQRFPFLGSILELRGLESHSLWWALARNRARYRTMGPAAAEEESIRMSPKLWPLVLDRPRRAFHDYIFDRNIELKGVPRGIPECNGMSITKTDCIYELLVICRGSFIDVLRDRRTKGTSPCDAGHQGSTFCFSEKRGPYPLDDTAPRKRGRT